MIKNMNFLTFWSINGPLNLDILKTQLVAFKEAGLDGVIFHPRNYPNEPLYLSEDYYFIVSTTIIEAKKMGLTFWLYDENGWPSGTASGKVLETIPDAKCEWLVYDSKKDVTTIQFETDVNSMDKNHVETFIEITYEGYKKGLTDEAFAYVTGFFSDEVGFLNSKDVLEKNRLPWSEEIEKRHVKQYGTSMKPHLNQLFNDVGGVEEKKRYWEILTDVLAETFYQPINKWCEDHGKLYTMHLKGEENLLFQMAYGGSSFQNLKHVSVPGVDALERYPGNNYYPRIASSLAMQFHTGDSLCEAMGGSGWGVCPETFEIYVKWLIDSGINHVVFHLSQYELNASAIKDWPPSMPLHLSWKAVFPVVLEKLRTYANKELPKKAHIKTLIVAPTRGVMKEYTAKQAMALNIHNGANTPSTPAGIISKVFAQLVEDCHKNGLDFHVTEERIIEAHGKFENNQLMLGKMAYDKIIIPPGCVFEKYHDELKPLVISNDTPWQLENPGENQYLLDLTWDGDEKAFTAQIPSRGISAKDLTLTLSDDISLTHIKEIENHIFITLKPTTGAPHDVFAWLKGDFKLLSFAPYIEKTSRQSFTEGPFVLTEIDGSNDYGDLLQLGYPFRTAPFIFTKDVHITKGASMMLLTNIHADAIRIWVDGIDKGWYYKDYLIHHDFSAGVHHIKIALIPSTFNQYGPHHHYNGDRHLTSPAQYEGKKNFADFDDAPDHTHVSGWHFVASGLGKSVIFLADHT